MDYVSGREKAKAGCVFCDIAANEAGERLLLIARSAHVFVILNRYPYTYGHTMVVPFRHISSQEEMDEPALSDLMVTTNRVMRLLRDIADPPGFNIGANIGEAAGAGIAAHYHFHIVPRWTGDANFMATISDSRIIPDTLANIARQMRAAWVRLYEPGDCSSK